MDSSKQCATQLGGSSSVAGTQGSQGTLPERDIGSKSSKKVIYSTEEVHLHLEKCLKF